MNQYFQSLEIKVINNFWYDCINENCNKKTKLYYIDTGGFKSILKLTISINIWGNEEKLRKY